MINSNCLHYDCGGCTNNECNDKEKTLCKHSDVACDKYVEDEPIYRSNLGENAKRMLEIGIVQDELVELGFSRFGIDEFILIDTDGNEIINVNFIYLTVSTPKFGGERYDFSYNSPTFREDLINKVKELIR